MEAQLEQIREQQKQSWDSFSPGWRKYNDFTMAFLQPTGEEIIRQLKLNDTDVVLDVATGTGEPGLSIAGIVKNGSVVGTDLSKGMLEVARENALIKGIRNYGTQVCDVCALPFPDATFDAISCRMGFMFFPDMLLAAKEMARVLKPGGRISTSVWAAPEKNPWVTSIMGPINRNLQLPSPPPGSPGMFRCAAPGFIADLFKQAGLKNITEKEIDNKVAVESFEWFWQCMNEVGAPIVAAMSNADNAMKQKIKKEALNFLQEKYPGKGDKAIDYEAIVISGQK